MPKTQCPNCGQLNKSMTDDCENCGADPKKVAELIGGTLILHDVTNDTAMIAGGDTSKITQ